MPLNKKQRTVFSANPEQVRQIRIVVQSRWYRSASELLREAIDEKLERLRRERFTAQVDRYCAEGLAVEDIGLIGSQAYPSGAKSPVGSPASSRRARATSIRAMRLRQA